MRIIITNITQKNFRKNINQLILSLYYLLVNYIFYMAFNIIIKYFIFYFLKNSMIKFII